MHHSIGWLLNLGSMQGINNNECVWYIEWSRIVPGHTGGRRVAGGCLYRIWRLMWSAVRALSSRMACYSHNLPLSSCWDMATGWNNTSIIHRPSPASKEQCVLSLSQLNPTLSNLSLTLTCRLECGAHTTQEVLSRTWVRPRRSHIGLPFALNILEICLSSDADVHFACP